MPPLPIQLTCVGCAADLHPADIDLARAAARCARCGADHEIQLVLLRAGDPVERPPLPSSALDPASPATVVRTAEAQAVEAGPIRVPVPRRPAGATPPADTDEPDLPAERPRVADRMADWPTFPTGMPTPATALQTHRDAHGLQIEWGWFGLPAIALMMGAAVWGTWIAGWVAASVLLAGTALGPWMVLGAAVHLIATFGLTYAAAAGLLDRTRVRVTDAALDVWHGPIPWPGPRRLPARRVAALEVVPRTVRGRDGWVELFDVVAVLDDRHRGLLASRSGGRVVVARSAFTHQTAAALRDDIDHELGGTARRIRADAAAVMRRG